MPITNYGWTADLVRRRTPFSAVTSSAMLTTRGLQAAIARYFDQTMLDAIAAEWLNKGRSLAIGTTNLYALRPVLWRIQHIAASDHPNALALVRKILLASASIPIAFPPVHIEVEVGDKRYDEMHVDGGAAAQVFLYPTSVDWREIIEKLDVKGTPNVYIIRNSRIQPNWEEVKPRLLIPILILPVPFPVVAKHRQLFGIYLSISNRCCSIVGIYPAEYPSRKTSSRRHPR